MENTNKDTAVSQSEALNESLRVQKSAYIKEHLRRQRAAEDARLERLLQEQDVIDGMRESIDDDMWQTEEAKRYNQEFQERVNMQIYESNGITKDKLIGMREYKNALYRGCAAALFLLSLALTVLCGVLHGFQSEICLLMFAYTAMECALLAQTKKPLLDFICKILHLLSFPMMAVMFVCFELGFTAYGLLLPYAVILGVVVTVLGTVSYFLQDPYRQDKKKIHIAQSQIRTIEKLAEKEVRKKQKLRKKEERTARKHLESEEPEPQLALEEPKPAKKPRAFAERFKKLLKRSEEPAAAEAEELDPLPPETEPALEAEPAKEPEPVCEADSTDKNEPVESIIINAEAPVAL